MLGRSGPFAYWLTKAGGLHPFYLRRSQPQVYKSSFFSISFSSIIQSSNKDHIEQNNHDILIWRWLGHDLLIVLAHLSMAHNRAIWWPILVTPNLVHLGASFGNSSNGILSADHASNFAAGPLDEFNILLCLLGTTTETFAQNLWQKYVKTLLFNSFLSQFCPSKATMLTQRPLKAANIFKNVSKM